MSIPLPVLRAVPLATRVRLLFAGAEAQSAWLVVGATAMSLHQARAGGLGMVVFTVAAAIGAVVAIRALVRGVRAIRLLRGGRVAEAALTHRRVSRGSGLRGRVYTLTFAFTDDRGARREVTGDTADPERFAADTWPVVYDGARGHVLALLPGAPRIVGGTVPSEGWPWLVYLYLPAAAVAVNALILLGP